MPEYVHDILEAVNRHTGYKKYAIRGSHAQNGNWCLDICNEHGKVIIDAERIGTKNEIAMFISGMFQMIKLPKGE